MLEVLESARFVARESRWVRIDETAVSRFAGEVVRGGVAPPPWDAERHFSGPPDETAAWILVLDTVNFCFWPPPGEETWSVRIGGRSVSGYNALALSLKRAVESGVPLTEAGFLADLSSSDLAHVLGGRGVLQLLDERARALRELGRVLERDYGGKAVRLIEAPRGWAGDLARLLARKCPSFRDTAVYRERAVYFYKRGQILAADLHGALGGRGPGHFHDLDRLTAFADYKLPQVLRDLGVLVYNDDLASRVDRMELLEPGGPEEVEIRANTIVAVERIRDEAAGAGRRFNAAEIDGVLWCMGQGERHRSRPYHRVRTIFY
jgi:hypothetical protein